MHSVSYRRTSTGCVVYSVGDDGLDNGGLQPDGGGDGDIAVQLTLHEQGA